ncbi:fumarylacetoacetate hydrolase family protein [Bacillus sp. DX1.1]|uniref:fumarylacetoacetate hydrolase family protein n=1 Tax=unclassified Bacillus (in: firmicutes) TaxID=185979 RepID=UPI00256FF842|nr:MULTISPECIES: fumarylacetoacetate hydrolase family protein [unclassified Bacillus (in: firmicutes)]MDM5153799.1 fumarylacetoacetate hydrolase family protein [Bacillus sp. DX1.1]WJE84009.1 fumarylacetoacetate hydrolase family protein [Bacillus sp. DX3.1]
MRLVTVKKEEKIFVGVVDDYEHTVLHIREAQKQKGEKVTVPITMLECIEQGNAFIEKVNEIVRWAKENETTAYYLLSDVKILAPIPRPRKNILCVGKNYRDHAIEMGGEEAVPKDIMIFTKAPTTVIGDGEQIHSHPHATNELDYEGELAIVIGKRGKQIAKNKALEHVFGYTILNDVTARDIQRKHKQFFLGKSFDTFCPMGPYLVHKTYIESPNELNVETKINGEVRQSSNTANMMFSIEDIISIVSKGMTLEPGDIIATGTPAGVGKGFTPPKFLHAGDEVMITVQHIGTLHNTVK